MFQMQTKQLGNYAFLLDYVLAYIFFLYILDFKSCRSLYHISKYAHVFNEKNEIYYVHLHAYIYFHTLFIFINISTHTHTHAHMFSSSFTSVVHTHIYICKVTLRLLNQYVSIADVAEWSRALNIRLRRLVLQCITVGV